MFIPDFGLRRLRRIEQVVAVLVKFGFGEMLTRIRVWEAGIARHILRRQPGFHAETPGHRLRMAIEELGPTYIKLGQILSTRPDLVSPDIVVELKKLQSSAHFIPIETVKATIQQELGRPVEEIFDSFDETPLGAASLAQVHHAVYRGRHVAIKVQRPGIADTARGDIDIMRRLAHLTETYFPSLTPVNLAGMVDEFADQIRKELDFQLEANNMNQFACNFANDDTLHVPEVFPELCTRRLITMEYLDGISISDTRRLAAEGYDMELIARRGAILGFKAIFQHGFFHADPHAGNVIVLPGNVIGLVDYGMMATLSGRDRERLARLVYFISIQDEKMVARALNDLMETEDTVPAEELEPAMMGIIQQYGNLSGREMRLAAMLFTMMQSVLHHGGRMRSQLVWVAKSLAVQEDIVRSLEADLDIFGLSAPYARQVITRGVNPFRQPQGIYFWLLDTLSFVKELPYDIGIIVREFRKGRLKIEFEHIGLEPIRRTMERVANRTILTIILSSLLISSSLIVLADVPPHIGNIPVLGFAGYLIALFLLFLLMIAVIKR